MLELLAAIETSDWQFIIFGLVRMTFNTFKLFKAMKEIIDRI